MTWKSYTVCAWCTKWMLHITYRFEASLTPNKSLCRYVCYRIHYCIGFLKSAAKIQIKNEIFLRSCEKVQNLTQE